MDPIDILASALDELGKGDAAAAGQIVHDEYPFRPAIRSRSSFSERKKFEIFARDGFVDRYSGSRLLFPGALRLLHLLLPQQVPYHPNWKMDETHVAFWELFPTVDHVEPVARGGSNEDDNLVTTCQLRNSAKANWTLEELGWKLQPRGTYEDWDGLTRHVLTMVAARPELLEDAILRKWVTAARTVSR
jgi:hypothetical protein